MNDLVVRAWKKYGNDYLLLVDRQSGDMVGHYDRKTGKLSMREPARQYEATDALRPFMQGAAPQPPARPHPSRHPTPPIRSTRPADKDLASNAPGAALSDKVEAATPTTSRFQRVAARLLRIRTEETSWQVGAAGERTVGKSLDRLKRQGWYILHSIRLRSGADVDHLVIGPAGVFTVNTKHHPDARIWIGSHTVKVNGTQYPYLRNSRHEAQSASRRLAAALRIPVPVTPVLAFVNPRELTLASAPPDILVARGEAIDRQLSSLRSVLMKQDQDRIYDTARHPDLWLA